MSYYPNIFMGGGACGSSAAACTPAPLWGGSCGGNNGAALDRGHHLNHQDRGRFRERITHIERDADMGHYLEHDDRARALQSLWPTIAPFL